MRILILSLFSIFVMASCSKEPLNSDNSKVENVKKVQNSCSASCSGGSCEISSSGNVSCNCTGGKPDCKTVSGIAAPVNLSQDDTQQQNSDKLKNFLMNDYQGSLAAELIQDLNQMDHALQSNDLTEYRVALGQYEDHLDQLTMDEKDEINAFVVSQGWPKFF